MWYSNGVYSGYFNYRTYKVKKVNWALNQDLIEEIYNKIRDRLGREPREGIHLSDLTLCLMKSFHRKRGYSPPPTREQLALFISGFAFQEYLFKNSNNAPVVLDGIHCTLDVLPGIEVKSTRQSMKRFKPEEMGHWERQILGYCKTLERTEFDLVVFFVCGDYGAKRWDCPKCRCRIY